MIKKTWIILASCLTFAILIVLGLFAATHRIEFFEIPVANAPEAVGKI